MRIKLFLATIVIALITTSLTSLFADEKPPNILLILTDDQGWPTLNCYGGTKVPTPNLDRLAKQGIKFTNAYVTPQCTPTRASLLTGQHTARNGMWHVIGRWYGYPWAKVSEPSFVQNLSPQTYNLAKGLKQVGYKTAIAGKWHLTQNEHGNYVSLSQKHALEFGFDWSPQSKNPNYLKRGDKGVDWLTQQAIDFMDRHPQAPWFIYLSHHTLHGPVVAPEGLVQKYRNRGAPKEGHFNATYLAAIEHMDRSIGTLMQAIDKRNLTKNTIIVFLSDNGGIDTKYVKPHTVETTASNSIKHTFQIAQQEYDNTPLRAGKGSPYEGGIRVPCIIRWPAKISGGTICNTPIHVTDWLPTLMRAANAQVPAQHIVDGVDLSPLFSGHNLPERDLFWYLPLYDLNWGATPCAIVRSGEWKLIKYFGDYMDEHGVYHTKGKTELYNLNDDIGESRNLSETHPHKTALLNRKIDRWLTSLNRIPPQPNPHYVPAKGLLQTNEKQPWNE